MAGAGYKLFNTGDVLTAAQVNTYLMEQTVMVFADATARTTALSGVVAEGMLSYLKSTKQVEVYNGSAWVASDDPNAIQNTIVDAKGDLIAASAADTPARLAVGANGETLVADSSATTGLRWQADWNTGKNKIINGDFGIWQRGTSFSNPSTGAYTADRFQIVYDGSGATRSITRETFTPGSAPVSGYEGQFFFRYARTVAGSAATNDRITQYIEDVRSLAGQTITISFWAKIASGTHSVVVRARQNFGSGGSASVDKDTTVSVDTNWTRYTATVALDSLSGKTIGTNSSLEIHLRTTVNTVVTLDLWGLQVEAGSVATPFTTATGTLAGELAACQRYYWRSSADATINARHYGLGIAYLTTGVLTNIINPVPMRIAPTSVDFASVYAFDGVTSLLASNVTLSTNRTNQLVSACDVTVTGATQYRTYFINSGGITTGYIGFSAEL